MIFDRLMCRPHAGEALGFGFDHRTTVVVAVGTLLLQFELDRRQFSSPIASVSIAR